MSVAWLRRVLRRHRRDYKVVYSTRDVEEESDG